MQGDIWPRIIAGAAIALLLMHAHAYPAKTSPKSKTRAAVVAGKQIEENKPASVQVLTFPDTEWNPVKIIRGRGPTAEAKPTEKPAAAELVTFADPRTKPVRVLRGDGEHPAATGPIPQASGMHSELVRFVDPRFRPVTVLRGSVASLPPAIGLFGPAREADLDRIAFAVEGAESSHGTDPRMWGPEPNGPQGPMQVSAAAAADVGGGNRFDIFENRMLGRGYLALMYRRYGNWPDAIAAYNWGPGNMDAWIGSGRPSAGFPLEVERYRDRVLRDVGLDRAVAALLFGGSGQLPAIPVFDARPRATVAHSTR
ncbi:MAG TPA: lytic transglycosylase domain-containing protein [Stellaceae bacterium]|nr:lytic transglycosylase domain-containing protein [Stellaceae bacterium]